MTREAAYDPVFDAQRDFRVLLDSMARPGQIRQLDASKLSPPPNLHQAAAAACLALLNADVTIWSADEQAGAYIRENTRSASAPADQADFLLIADGRHAEEVVAGAKCGTPLYPEGGATLIVQTGGLAGDAASGWLPVEVEGPGTDGVQRFSVAGLGPIFWATLAQKNAEFPLGVELLLTDRERLVSLPRSARARWGGGQWAT